MYSGLHVRSADWTCNSEYMCYDRAKFYYMLHVPFYGSNIIRTIVHILFARFMMACFRAVLFTTSHHHDRRRPPTADGECSRPRPRTSTGPPLEKVCHPGSPCPPRSHPRSCKSPQTAPSSHTQILGGFYMHPLLKVCELSPPDWSDQDIRYGPRTFFFLVDRST
jgi:hypothetical protein